MNDNELNQLSEFKKFFFNSTVDISLASFILSIIISAILAYLIKIAYLQNSQTLSNKSYFSDQFIPLATITCLVITVIKFSLALSLGLVGALSIVRFRAAIKEPEELVYLFLIITSGLGCGSGQLKITIVGVIFSLIVIFIYYKVFERKKIDYSELINLSFTINNEINDSKINKIIYDLKRISTELNFISLSKTNEITILNLDIRPKKFEELTKIIDLIKKRYKNSKIIIARSNNLNL